MSTESKREAFRRLKELAVKGEWKQFHELLLRAALATCHDRWEQLRTDFFSQLCICPTVFHTENALHIYREDCRIELRVFLIEEGYGCISYLLTNKR